VDTATQDPCRIMGVAGTYKCKGENTRERPWRRITIDTPTGFTPAPFDLIPWLGPEDAETAEVRPAGNSARKSPGPGRRPDLSTRATAYLAAMPPAISGSGGHAQTFDAACALVKGFHLSPTDAYPFLSGWNLRCQPPWSDAELWHKLTSADAKADVDKDGSPQPRGYLIDAGRGSGATQVEAEMGGEGDVPERSYATPHDLARNILADHYDHPDGSKLRYWNADYYSWNGAVYRAVKSEEFDKLVNRYIEEQFEADYAAKVEEYEAKAEVKKKSDQKPRRKAVTRTIVADVMQALGSIVLMSSDLYPDQPAWIAPRPGYPAREMLPTAWGLIHIPSFVAGMEYRFDPTPNFFSCYSLDYAFDPDAPEPSRWLEFLRQL